MTEQELRERIARLEYERTYKPGNDLLSGFAGEVKWEEAPERQREYCYRYADQIHALYKQAGYVRLAEDQTLPFVPEWKLALKTGCFARKEAQVEVIQQGWRKVELEESSVIENGISNDECWIWVARKPCGCTVAASVDDQSLPYLKDDIFDMVKRGLIITHEQGRVTLGKCPKHQLENAPCSQSR